MFENMLLSYYNVPWYWSSRWNVILFERSRSQDLINIAYKKEKGLILNQQIFLFRIRLKQKTVLLMIIISIRLHYTRDIG